MRSEIRFAELAQLRKESVDPRFTPDAPYVGLEHIEPGTLQLTNFGRASDVTSQKLKFYKGDVLFGKLRPYFRKIATAPLDGVCSTDIWVVTGKDTADNEFIKYWMASDTFIRSSTQAAEGSSMPRAQWSWVSEFRTSVVSGAERRSIGRLLGALDDKIALNLQTSQVLEQIAQTIFKSWFIDFDPVHAKARGEQPGGLDEASTSLFPDSFEDSDYGEIPSGWRIGFIRELGKVITGKTPSTKIPEYWSDGPYPFITIPDLHKTRFPVKTQRFISEAGSLSQEITKLPPHSVVVSCIATAGLIGYTTVESHTNQQINAVVVEREDTAIWVLHKLIDLSPEIKKQSAIGTVFPNLNKTGFGEIRTVIPPASLIQRFSDDLRPFVELQIHLEAESASLAEIRDALLPRLISGELEIPEELLVD